MKVVFHSFLVDGWIIGYSGTKLRRPDLACKAFLPVKTLFKYRIFHIFACFGTAFAYFYN